MPDHFKTKFVKDTPSRSGRGLHFDRSVAALAEVIGKHQAGGIRDIRKLVNCLNEEGVPSPNGKVFTYGTMQRVLARLKELHLGPGARDASAAASQRPPRLMSRQRRRSPISEGANAEAQRVRTRLTSDPASTVDYKAMTELLGPEGA
jgi:hypothetical protein